MIRVLNVLNVNLYNSSKIQNYVTISNQNNLIQIDANDEKEPPNAIKKITSFHLPKKSFDYDRLNLL
jgi:hypothetical protein